MKNLAIFLFLCFELMYSTAFALTQLTAHGGPVKSLALSSDGRWLVSTSFDYSAVIWRADSMTEERRLLGHEAAVNAAAFSPDGKWLVTSSDDLTLRAWRMDEVLDKTSEPAPLVLNGHRGRVVHLAFSPDGSRLTSSGWDHRIGLWSAPDFELLTFLKTPGSSVNATVFSRDNSLLFSAGADGHIRQWDVASAKYLKSIMGNGWGINVFIVDENKDFLAYGTATGAVNIRSLRADEHLKTLLPEGPPILSLSYDPENGRLVCGNAEGRVLVIDTDSQTVEYDFHAAKGPVWAAQIMPDAKSVVFAGLDDFITQLPLHPELANRVVDANQADRRFHPATPLENGARQFARKCSICHTLAGDDQRRAGPSLEGVFGRKAGTAVGYAYSPALAESDLVWTEETIDALFRDGPDVVTPGSKMPLQRIPNAKNRHDLIEYLKSNTIARLH